MTLSALSCLLLLSFSACKDDDPDGGTLNLKIDNSLITRPAKANRYSVLAQDKVSIMEIESKTLSLPLGTYPIFVVTNLANYDIQGSTFYMPLDEDGYISTDLVSENFGTAVKTVTVTEKLTTDEVKLIPIDQMKIKVTLDYPGRVKAITVKLNGVIEAWDYLADKPVGSAGTIMRTKTNISSSSTKDYSFSQMFFGFYPGATPSLEVTIEFNDTLEKYVQTVSGEELIGEGGLMTIEEDETAAESEEEVEVDEDARTKYLITFPAEFGQLE